MASGNDLTYLVDLSDGGTASGLTAVQTEAAVDTAMATWGGTRALSKIDVVKNTNFGADPDIVDFFLGFGGLGNPFLADITHAGWLPKGFFEALAPGGGDSILGVMIPFYFVSAGVPTDINNDQYLDTALVEIYYNDNFGDPVGSRSGSPWGIGVALPGVDVETVALHEGGHGIGVGHFGPPPTAVMNPVYAGIRTSPFPIDESGLKAQFKKWPNR